jgi:hypothetical protein
LAETWQGMSRSEILAHTGLSDGGNTTRTLEELVNSGFLDAYFTFGKKKKELRDDVRLKMAIFKSATATTKQLFFTLLTSFPLVPNEHSLSIVDSALSMDCLFEPF